MKDATPAEIERGTAQLQDEALEWIDFCLRKLYADTEHSLVDVVVHGLVFEEVFGALLTARARIRLLEHGE